MAVAVRHRVVHDVIHFGTERRQKDAPCHIRCPPTRSRTAVFFLRTDGKTILPVDHTLSPGNFRDRMILADQIGLLRRLHIFRVIERPRIAIRMDHDPVIVSFDFRQQSGLERKPRSFAICSADGGGIHERIRIAPLDALVPVSGELRQQVQEPGAVLPQPDRQLLRSVGFAAPDLIGFHFSLVAGRQTEGEILVTGHIFFLGRINVRRTLLHGRKRRGSPHIEIHFDPMVMQRVDCLVHAPGVFQFAIFIDV